MYVGLKSHPFPCPTSTQFRYRTSFSPSLPKSVQLTSRDEPLADINGEVQLFSTPSLVRHTKLISETYRFILCEFKFFLTGKSVQITYDKSVQHGDLSIIQLLVSHNESSKQNNHRQFSSTRTTRKKFKLLWN